MELVSQLLYAGKSLEEVAGYDTFQLMWIIGRRRGRDGRLIRRGPDLPPWVEVDEDGMRIVTNPVAYGDMFRQVGRRARGLDPREVERQWRDFLRENPALSGRGAE